MSAVAILDVSGADSDWKLVQSAITTLPLATSLLPGESTLEMFSASTASTNNSSIAGTPPGAGMRAAATFPASTSAAHVGAGTA